MKKCPFRERYLQIIWNERFLCSRPVCEDGRVLRVVSGGIWNRGKGPDFQDAALLLDDQLLRGDVELHRFSSEWFLHGHAGDPAYDRVILHVVWCDDLKDSGSQTGLPTLELKDQLLDGWERLFQSVEMAFYPHAREVPPGACALRWALTDDERLQEILTAAGRARFQRHGREMMRRVAETDPDQALYERLFDVMGYASNRRQFRTLAQEIPLKALLPYAQDQEALAAVLFGAARLLPDVTTSQVHPDFDAWLKKAWKIWWNSGLTAPDIAWNPYGGRPLNSVCRRLAAGVCWLHQCRCRPLEWLEQTENSANGDGRKLLKALTFPLQNEKPWNRFRDFQNPLPHATALLGIGRRRDLAMNVLLPFLGARAELEGDTDRRETACRAWECLPRSQDNHLVRQAILRFLTPPSRWRALIQNAAQQQGMMDIFQNFCMALEHDCNECPFVVVAE